MLKQLQAQKVTILGDSELIIKQIKGEYSTRNLRLREYQNATLDLLKTFEKYELVFIPRSFNHLANELSFNASNCQIPKINEQLSVKVKHRPTMPDNVDHWQVFDSDQHIEYFLKSENDFTIPTSESSHNENCPYIEEIPEAEITHSADINNVGALAPKNTLYFI